MSIEINSSGYWVSRLAEAVDNGLVASNEPARNAYVDLARHYWSMHLMVNGKQDLRGVDARVLKFIAPEPERKHRSDQAPRHNAA